MVRLRAVPSAVWTAVGALAFLASTGLVLVLSAGLHVWTGPATRIIDATGHVLRGAGSGLVAIPGAARLAHPVAHPTAPTTAVGPTTPGPVAAVPPARPVPAPPSAPATGGAGQGAPTAVSGGVSSTPARVRGGLPSFFRSLNQIGLTVDRAIVAATTPDTTRGHGPRHLRHGGVRETGHGRGADGHGPRGHDARPADGRGHCPPRHQADGEGSTAGQQAAPHHGHVHAEVGDAGRLHRHHDAAHCEQCQRHGADGHAHPHGHGHGHGPAAAQPGRH